MDDVVTSAFWLTRFCFQRGLGVIYLSAFVGTLNQFPALLGEKGLLPVPQYLKFVGFRDAPSIFHLHYSDRFLKLVAWTGIVLSLLATTGLSDVFGTPVSIVIWLLLWALYLSIVNVGQTFYAFGWESILLETGFLAIFLGGAGTEPSAITIWLLRWVLFRIMLGAGLIKMRGDECWKKLTCMFYHYETQPLPNPLSWYFHHLPKGFHKFEVFMSHVIQLLIPFGYFLPQPYCAIAGALTLLYQGMLIVSGNYAWLNWITVVLAISCFPDALLSTILSLDIPLTGARSVPHEAAIAGLASLVALLSVRPILNMLSRNQIMNTSFDPLHLVGTYGAFGSVTKERIEVIVEGTSEPVLLPQTQWQEYGFKAKPGDLHRLSPQIAPYHLRLDWLMWFLPFRPRSVETWFLVFAEKLLHGDTAVRRLLGHDPFPDTPPRFIRARFYEYQFTTQEERRRTKAWWKRTLVGEYLPPVALQPEQ